MSIKANIYYAGFNSRVGGAYFHVVNIEKGFKELGYEVDVITLDRLPLLIRYLPHILQKIGNIMMFPFGFLWKQWMIKHFYKMMFKNSADIEIFEDIYTYWKSDNKSIVLLHALWSDNLQAFEISENDRVKLEKEETKLINSIDKKIITVSKPYKKFLLSRLETCGLKKNIDVVELGVDTNKFNKVKKVNQSMVFVGLLEARKNIKFLLNVFNEVVNKDNNFKLTIIGDGSQKNELLEYIKYKNIKNVTFKGRLSHKRVLKELQNHQYYLHTSTKESFSYSLLEAKLSGLTTIAYSKLEVPSEFIDIKVSDFEVKEWVEKILNSAYSDEVFFADKYTYQNMTKRTMDLL